MKKYLEALIRDLAADGLIEHQDTTVLTEDILSYITGVLMQAKIENNVNHVERLQPGVLRHLGIKSLAPVAA